MKKVTLLVFAAFCIFTLGGCAAVDHTKQTTLNTVNAQSHDSKITNLAKYTKIGIKPILKSDTTEATVKNENFRIMGTIVLEGVLGNESAEFKTKFIYAGNKVFESDTITKWLYYYHPSWKERRNPGRGQLKYKRNAVMETAKPGDLLVIGKNGNNDIDIIIVQQNSPFEKQVYDFLNKKPKSDTEPVKVQETLVEKTQPKTELSELKIEQIKNKSYIQVYFTPGKDCENNIIGRINTSKKIDIAVYGITNRNIVNAIFSAQRRGAKIRVITDNLQSHGKSALADELKAAGLDVRTNYSTKHKIEHNKIAVFDDKEIVTGSYNWTESATKKNSENCLFTNDIETRKAYSERFMYLWKFYDK